TGWHSRSGSITSARAATRCSCRAPASTRSPPPWTRTGSPGRRGKRSTGPARSASRPDNGFVHQTFTGGPLDCNRTVDIVGRVDAARIAAIPLFSDLSEADLARVAEVASELEVDDGKTLTTEGEFGHCLFAV